MKYFGIALLLVSAFLFASGYKSRREGETAALCDLLLLLRHIEERVTLYFEPPRAWASSFVTDNKELGSLMLCIREGGALSDAFGESAFSRRLSARALELATGAFAEMGRGCAADEGRVAAKYRKEAEQLLSEERERARAGSRLAASLSLLLSIGVAILII